MPKRHCASAAYNSHTAGARSGSGTGGMSSTALARRFSNMRVTAKRSMSPRDTVAAKARATARRRLRSAASMPSSANSRSESSGNRAGAASAAMRPTCVCVSFMSSMPSSGASLVSCVRHLAGSDASMVATKAACTAIGDFSTCARKIPIDCCCSWLSRLRSTSGGSTFPPIMRTPDGSVSSSARRVTVIERSEACDSEVAKRGLVVEIAVVGVAMATGMPCIATMARAGESVAAGSLGRAFRRRAIRFLLGARCELAALVADQRAELDRARRARRAHARALPAADAWRTTRSPSLFAHDGVVPAKNICATLTEFSCCSCEPSAVAAMVMNAPCSALGLRVNCTAEASARCSRRRDTAACNSRPASKPTLPAMNTPKATILMRPAPLPRLRPRMMRMARSVITNRPKIHAVSRMLMRMSPLRM